jgi:hypothetical protein
VINKSACKAENILLITMSRVIKLFCGIVIIANLLIKLEPTSASLELDGLACYAMALSIPGLKSLSGDSLLPSMQFTAIVR